MKRGTSDEITGYQYYHKDTLHEKLLKKKESYKFFATKRLCTHASAVFQYEHTQF